MRLCDLPECDKKHYGKGFCRVHFRRMKANGDPRKVKIVHYPDPEEAFEARTMPEPNTGCLLWIGGTSSSGYGRIYVRKSQVFSHRYAWEREYGLVPEGLIVDHKCHTPQCVNVDHLRLASRKENSWNRGTSIPSKSGYRNVYPSPGGRWRVRISNKHFGTYSTVEEAAQVAEQKRKELFGDFAGRG